MIVGFFSLPLGIGPNDKGALFCMNIHATIYLPVCNIKPMSSIFLGECVEPLGHSGMLFNKDSVKDQS